MEKPATNGVTNAEHLGLVPAKFKPAQPGQKRKFPLEFKKACVDRVQHGEAVTEVARATGVHESQLHRWLRGESLNMIGGGKGGRKRNERSGKRATSPIPKNQPEQKAPRSAVERSTGAERQIKDALFYLTQAEKWCYQSLREGRIDSFDQAHDWARQALRELEKL